MKRILKVLVLLALAVALVFNTTACSNVFGQPATNEDTVTSETTSASTPEVSSPELTTPGESTP
ncbi:MAG: hypothetical protein J6Q06_04805, partial [Clostridia bacterium]|nr:hypothetical protein [Clostridia bacterium]